MNIKSFLNRKYAWFFLAFIVWLPIYFLLLPRVFNVKERINNKNCEAELKIKAKAYYGVITAKFEDERKLKFFRFHDGKDTLVSELALLSDDFYDYIKLGDSIRKEVGSLKFIVRRDGRDTTQIIDFDCN